MADLGGAFAQVTNMEALKKRQEEDALAEQKRQYELRVQQQREDEATRPPGDSEWAYLDEQARTKLDRQGTALLKPIPDVAERLTKDLGPDLLPLAFETDTEKSRELRDDRPGRQARMEALLAKMTGPGSTPPFQQFYTDAPRASGARADAHPRPGRDTMPYEGAMEGLRGMDVPRAAIRQEFGGTAPDTTLSFTNRPQVAAEQGMRKWNAPGSRNEDVGAPGGGAGRLSTTGGEATRKQELIRQTVQGQIDEAKAAPRTLREQASELVSLRPVLNEKALQLEPNAMQAHIAELVANGTMSPQVGKQELGRFRDLTDQATNKTTGEFNRDLFNELVKREGDPVDSANTAVTAQVQQGGVKPAQAEQRKAAAVQDATTTPPDAPGSTPSPAVTADSGGFAGALRRGGLDRFGAPMPETPPGMAGTAARIGGPLAGGAIGSMLGAPNVGAGIGGAGGELLGQAVEGEPLDLGRAGIAGAESAAASKILGAVAPRVMGAAKSAKDYLFPRAANRIVEPIVEQAGKAAPSVEEMLRAEDAARQAARAPGKVNPNTLPVPRDPNLPPPGPDFILGEEGPLYSAQRPRPGQLQLPPPTLEEQMMQEILGTPPPAATPWEYVPPTPGPAKAPPPGSSQRWDLAYGTPEDELLAELQAGSKGKPKRTSQQSNRARTEKRQLAREAKQALLEEMLRGGK